MERGQRPRSLVQTYLGWSIFSTLCCCLPLGIAAIIFSRKVQDANMMGETSKAEEASRKAKIINISALVIGIIFLIINVVLFVLGFGFE